MSTVLAQWNSLSPQQAAEEILSCCGSRAWAQAMAARRPIPNEAALLAACDKIWNNLPESDWLEAFGSHPRIGESQAPASASAQSAAWSKSEQQRFKEAVESVKAAIAAGNRLYEKKFGRTFIVCATGKPVTEILAILERRLQNDEATELREAVEQQRQITHLRLKKWLAS
jgi:2-oxo-4-hydroxy-4-carboxy-5-ureidoimidazoline decarboxylase